MAPDHAASPREQVTKAANKSTFESRSGRTRRRHKATTMTKNHFCVGTHIDQHDGLLASRHINRHQIRHDIAAHVTRNNGNPKDNSVAVRQQSELSGRFAETGRFPGAIQVVLLNLRPIRFLTDRLNIETEKELPHRRIPNHEDFVYIVTADPHALADSPQNGIESVDHCRV